MIKTENGILHRDAMATSSADLMLHSRRNVLWERTTVTEKVFRGEGPNIYPHVYICLGYTSIGHDMADLDLFEELSARGNKLHKKTQDEHVHNKSNNYFGEDRCAPNDPFRSLFHKDAFLLFRSLCKLSMKNSLEDSSVDIDPVALQTKLLSLELIVESLKMQARLSAADQILYAVKHYLCDSLIKNCVSSNTRVVNLSLHIFVALISHFRDYLRSEIDVLLQQYF